MIRSILNELDEALLDITHGNHFIGLMIGDFTIYPFSWFLEEIKERFL